MPEPNQSPASEFYREARGAFILGVLMALCSGLVVWLEGLTAGALASSAISAYGLGNAMWRKRVPTVQLLDETVLVRRGFLLPSFGLRHDEVQGWGRSTGLMAFKTTLPFRIYITMTAIPDYAREDLARRLADYLGPPGASSVTNESVERYERRQLFVVVVLALLAFPIVFGLGPFASR